MREFEPLKIDPTGRYFIRLTEENLIEIKGPAKTTKGHLCKKGYQLLVVCLTAGKPLYIRGHVLSFIQWKNPNYKPQTNRISVIDHIDSNRSNNHPNNLQEILYRENSMKKVVNTGEYPLGVTKAGAYNKFNASIRFKGKKRYLGYFDSPQEAHRAYMRAYAFIKTHSEEEVQEAYPVRTRIKENEGANFNNQDGMWWAFYKKKYLGRFKTREEALKRKKEHILSLINNEIN